MKRKIVVLIGFILLSTTYSPSQVFSYDLAYYNGYGYIMNMAGIYEGYVSDGYAHGLGTFYFYTGAIYHGYFQNGWWNGEGFLLTYQGYIVGCWNYGNYVGDCQNYTSYYDDDDDEIKIDDSYVESNVNTILSSSNTQRSPEGYKITRIDPDTQLGKTLLGRAGQ